MHTSQGKDRYAKIVHESDVSISYGGLDIPSVDCPCGCFVANQYRLWFFDNRYTISVLALSGPYGYPNQYRFVSLHIRHHDLQDQKRNRSHFVSQTDKRQSDRADGGIDGVFVCRCAVVKNGGRQPYPDSNGAVDFAANDKANKASRLFHRGNLWLVNDKHRGAGSSSAALFCGSWDEKGDIAQHDVGLLFVCLFD